jgi:uncharacterized protein (TIGR02147 family)
MTSPASLNMILRGKRNPGPQILEQLIRYFDFSPLQRGYFETLVRLSKSKKDPQLLTRAMEDLRTLHPLKQIDLIDFNTFAVMSNWYFLTIREMVNRADFKEDSDWISKKLSKKVTPKKVQDALETLIKSGLLIRQSDGQLVASNSQISTQADVSSEAVKQFHEQMIEIAKESVRGIDVQFRDISGSTFNVDTMDLPALKEELRRVRKEIYQRFEKPNAKNTYQLNFQLFPLTEVETQISNNAKGGRG